MALGRGRRPQSRRAASEIGGTGSPSGSEELYSQPPFVRGGLAPAQSTSEMPLRCTMSKESRSKLFSSSSDSVAREGGLGAGAGGRGHHWRPRRQRVGRKTKCHKPRTSSAWPAEPYRRGAGVRRAPPRAEAGCGCRRQHEIVISPPSEPPPPRP